MSPFRSWHPLSFSGNLFLDIDDKSDTDLFTGNVNKSVNKYGNKVVNKFLFTEKGGLLTRLSTGKERGNLLRGKEEEGLYTLFPALMMMNF